MNMDQSRLISDNVLLDTNQTSNQSLRILQNVYKLLASRMESHSFSEGIVSRTLWIALFNVFLIRDVCDGRII